MDGTEVKGQQVIELTQTSCDGKITGRIKIVNFDKEKHQGIYADFMAKEILAKAAHSEQERNVG